MTRIGGIACLCDAQTNTERVGRILNDSPAQKERQRVDAYTAELRHCLIPVEPP